MRTSVSSSYVLGALTAVGLTASLVGTASAQVQDRDQDRTQEQDRTYYQTGSHGERGIQERDRARDTQQLRDVLRNEGKLNSTEVSGLEPELQTYQKLQGDPEHLRATVRASEELGCQGECMGEVVRTMNRAMLHGMQDREAGVMVRTTLQEQVRLQEQTRTRASEQALGDQLRIRVQEKLQQWEQVREQLRQDELQRDQEREMLRQMERQGPGASHGQGVGR